MAWSGFVFRVEILLLLCFFLFYETQGKGIKPAKIYLYFIQLASLARRIQILEHCIKVGESFTKFLKEVACDRD